jgi:hypothetical protein
MKKLNVGLWVLQGFLGLFLGLASGAPKLLLPIEALPTPVPMSQEFLWFVGACEVLGAIGLILPGVLRIRPGVTALAAACLVALTICAAAAQLMGGNPGSAAFAVGIGALCAVVAYGRWRLVPLGGARRTSVAAAG